MDRKEPKLVDLRSIVQRLEAIENQGAPENSLAELQDIDDRVTELERRLDELTDLVAKLKAALTI